VDTDVQSILRQYSRCTELSMGSTEYRRSYGKMIRNPPPGCNGAINRGTVQKRSTMADRDFQSFDFSNLSVLVFVRCVNVHSLFAGLAGGVSLPV